jgi:hypothetical protein
MWSMIALVAGGGFEPHRRVDNTLLIDFTNDKIAQNAHTHR